MSKIIEIADYSWKYINTRKNAIENINFSVEEGEFIGIIGPNGSGKTTLAYSMDGLIPGQYNGIKNGIGNPITIAYTSLWLTTINQKGIPNMRVRRSVMGQAQYGIKTPIEAVRPNTKPNIGTETNRHM